VERVTRIELVTEAWEAFVIPFHHTRHSNFDTQAALIPQAETIGLRWEWRALS
jgi:non-ribosomal peptide synthetase component F